MKFNNHISFIKAFAICAGFFSFAACKERSVINPDLIPAVDNIHTFEKFISDFDVKIQTGKNDSVRTDDVTYPIVTLGSIADDPFFGKTKAGFYFQIGLPGSNFYFPDNIQQIDSLVIALPMDSFTYGDTSASNDLSAVSVYRITDADFAKNDSSRIYYASDSLATDAIPLATDNVSFKAHRDSVYYPDGTGRNNLFRIHLPLSFANIFRSADTSNFRDNSTFKSFFRGFYIVGNTGADVNMQRRLSYINLGLLDLTTINNYDYARLEMFYTQTDGTKKLIIFPYAPGTRFFSRITRDYQGKPAQAFTSGAHDSVAVQTSPGIYTELTFNNIQDMANAVVNKAQLVLTVLKTGEDNFYIPPVQLIIYGVNDDGTTYRVADASNNSSSSSILSGFIGGEYKSVVINGQSYGQYTLNFPREMQNAVLSGKTSLKLRLATTVDYTGAFRMLADGINSNNPDTKLKLDVVYTKLN